MLPLLDVSNIHAYYGNIQALKGISLRVDEGEIVTLIGGNGAGKTTTLRVISGLLRPRQGSVHFAGTNLAQYPAHRLVYQGISMVPEGRGVFFRLTVQENLEMGAYSRQDSKAAIQQDLQEVLVLFPRLRERLGQVAGTLSGGEQQMLAMGRAMMARPKLLLLDEPSMGLAPILVDLIFEIIQRINQRGTTILLVEQNALMALQIAQRGYVLQTGEIVLGAAASQLQQDPIVQKAYLGLD
jgi:branched-chain amino acid transport system ATP-binding protein